MENFITEEVHISRIKGGDTIIHRDKMSTVSNNDIKYDSFIGASIFGDCYNLGYKKVVRVRFITKQ
jgi:hypothetical protein